MADTYASALSPQRAFAFLSGQGLAVISTVSKRGDPEAALINYAVTNDLELIFETLQTSRKYANLVHNPRAALVIGGEDGGRGFYETCQYEGIVDRPDEFALEPYLETYFAARPEGREHRGWPDLVYLRIRPTWIRISNYSRDWKVEELDWRDRASQIRLSGLPFPSH